MCVGWVRDLDTRGEEKDGRSIFYLEKKIATKMGKGYDRKRPLRQVGSEMVMTRPRKKGAGAVGEVFFIIKKTNENT